MAAAERRISDDLRYELADAARAGERANRPRGLVVLATVLFCVAGLGLIVALRQRERAASQLRLHTDYAVRVANLDAQFRRVREIAESGQNRGSDPLSNVLTSIEEAANSAGLRNKLAIPKNSSNARPNTGAVQKLYIYTTEDPSLEALLEWIEEARAAVPGLEVSGLDLSPTPNSWKVTVTFVRWERSS